MTADEVRTAAQNLPLGLREQYGTTAGQREFVDAVIARKLLRAEAHRLGIAARDDIKRQLDELEDRLTVQAMLHDAEQALGPPTEGELRAWFETHQSEFKVGARVRVTRILLHGKQDDANLRKKLDTIRARAIKKEPLEKLAALGEGPERNNTGDLGWISEGSDAETTYALALRPGDVSTVLESSTGLSILIATERVEERVPPFEELRETLSSRVLAGRQRRAFDELVKRLRVQANVQLNPAALQ